MWVWIGPHLSKHWRRDDALRLAQAVCDLALQFGESGEEKAMSRPFGVALLIAGWDDKGPCLFHCDPSGTYTRFDAKAIGAGSEGAQTALQARSLPPRPCSSVLAVVVAVVPTGGARIQCLAFVVCGRGPP